MIFGTHTHVQTSDGRVLPGGTGYITDLGMCGAVDSVLGVKKECVIKKFRTHMPVRFENPSGETELDGAVFVFDMPERKIASVKTLKKRIYCCLFLRFTVFLIFVIVISYICTI